MGEPGQDASGTPVPLAADGLVGSVRDPSGQLLTAGTIYLVPTSDVAELSKQTLDLTLSPDDVTSLEGDEPLEDLLDANASDYQHAAIGEDGSYRFEQLDKGSYFVVFVPDGADAAHLPGGSACRTAADSESLVGTRVDIEVSGRPSERAGYVGSSACFNCHGRHRSMRSAHRVSLQVPGARGPYQDISPWGDAFDAALRDFDQGKTFYYYACDPGRAGDAKCSVSDTDPAPQSVSFELRLTRDPMLPLGAFGAYTAQFTNRAGSGTASYAVALTYGGALYRQQYLVRRDNGDGSYRYDVLPLQYNQQGSLASADPSDWPYTDYRSDRWYDFTNSALARPDAAHSFDQDCAGCHLTGMQLASGSGGGVSARAVSDPNGDFDFDGDGRSEEINVGCESCHGPGSEHIEAARRGLAIVSPSLLTPGRALLICGRCHSRPNGAFAGGSHAPLSAAGRMPVAGLRRAQYAHEFTSRVDAPADQFFDSGDSKANHQQYTDFLRSSMARNASVLMTCDSCHDPHGSDDDQHMLRKAQDDDTACTGCHSGEVYTSIQQHLKKATGFVHDNVDEALFSCTTCHMVKTVTAGVRHPELLDNLPRDATPVQYYHGDIASHRFTVTRRARADEQPVAATLGCAFCHGTLFDNP